MRRRSVIVAITTLVGLFSLQPFLASAATYTRTLAVGSSGSDVAALQTFLESKGFYTYPSITGYFGAVTESALKAFQSSVGLEPVGEVGPKTQAILNGSTYTESTGAPSNLPASFTRDLDAGTSGSDVTALQRWLIAQGYTIPAGATGYYGSQTKAAVAAYQAAHGITPPAGRFGPATRASISLGMAAGTTAPPDQIAVGPDTYLVPGVHLSGGTPRHPETHTGGTSDTTPPVRSGGAPSGTLALNTTSTTISLDTDESATCAHATSPGTAYGSMTSFDTTGGTTHSSTVSGLTNGGSYVYYVKCEDAAGNINADDYTISFTVAADTTSPSVTLDAPANNATVSGSVALSATASDDVSVSGVQFKLDTNTLIGAEDTSSPYTGTWDSTGVADGSHTLVAVARDGSGNYATSSVATVTVDNTAPVLSSISSGTPGASSATITWSTDEGASSTVNYGLTSSYGTASTSDALTTSHSITVTGLSEGTTYHFQVASADSQGNVATSSDQTFTTGSSYAPLGLTFLPYNGLGTNSALGVTNSTALTYSFWLMGTYNNANPTTMVGTETWGDPGTFCEVTGGTAPGICNSVDTTSGRFQLNFNDSTGTVNASNAVKFIGQAGSNGTWHHYLVSFDTHTQNSALYIDGVDSGVHANPIPADLLPDLNNSHGFHLGGKTTAQPAVSLQYQAEIVAAETSIVCTGAGTPTTMNGISVTCSAANTIPPEILSKFIADGKPLDLGSSCQNPFGGRSSEVCVRGSNTSNSGTGGALSPQVFSTASYGGVYAAPYGPAGIPAHQATMKWLQAKNGATVTSNSMTTNAASNPISVGDLIVIVAGISNSSGNTNYAMTCPSGFSQIGPVNDTFESVNSEACYKILTGGDTSGAYTITWNSGGAARTHDWVMADYGNVASVDQTGSLYNGATVTTSHKTASGLTTTSANETVVSAWVDWNAAVNTPFTPPGTGTLRYRLSDVGSPLQMMLVDEYSVANGSNPQRTMTTGSAVTSAGFTLTLVPN
ncbi:MAG TPA: peptidoglycan-binding protein [Candidatus Paceibacterota bacterium]|nr:peptidoglycan-binding protein [Candidatus Paceibacterota bacterium]